MESVATVAIKCTPFGTLNLMREVGFINHLKISIWNPGFLFSNASLTPGLSIQQLIGGYERRFPLEIGSVYAAHTNSVEWLLLPFAVHLSCIGGKDASRVDYQNPSFCGPEFQKVVRYLYNSTVWSSSES
ncbi:unnamed protein product [Fraxinus pennsylvanica]|uniref:Uncharacterized protein n=1 Tax=Fraxinus pennsylvanica TaxID=56036 RepID=A0AAD2AED7_9LAMI|nr:unnamed protein product [Fraxinus pennsylvanica]